MFVSALLLLLVSFALAAGRGDKTKYKLWPELVKGVPDVVVFGQSGEKTNYKLTVGTTDDIEKTIVGTAVRVVDLEGAEQNQDEKVINWSVKVEGDLSATLTVNEHVFGPLVFAHNQIGVLEASSKSGKMSVRISPRANGSFDATVVEGHNIRTIRVNQKVTKKQSSPLMKILPMVSLLLIPLMRKFQAGNRQAGQADGQQQPQAQAPAPGQGQ